MVCAIMMAGLFTGASAEEFVIGGLHFKVLSESEKTCELYKADNNIGDIFLSNDWFTPPSRVENNGKIYTVKGIGPEAFRGNKNITMLSISSTYEYVGNAAFFECTNLRIAWLSEGLKRLGVNAFGKCTSLTSVGMQERSNNMLPTGLNSIGDYCFYECSSLQTISIPKSCSNIGKNGPFAFCSSLKEIIVEEGNSHFHTDKGVLYTNSYQLVCFPPCFQSGSSYTILDETVEIYPYAFVQAFRDYSKCRLTIPESVEEIGENAFYDYKNIQRINVEWEGKSLQNLKMASQIFGGDGGSSEHFLYVPIGTTGKYQAMSQWSGLTIEEYDVKIKDFKINNEEVYRSTLNEYVTRGKLEYDAVSKELTMNNCKLSQKLTFTNKKTLTVYLYHENIIDRGSRNEALAIEEDCEVIIDGYYDEDSKLITQGGIYIDVYARLGFFDLNLEVQGMSNNTPIAGLYNGNGYITFNHCNATITNNNNNNAYTISKHIVTELDNCHIIQPEGAYVDEEGMVRETDGTICDEDIKIEPGEVYDFTVNGIHVTDNYFPGLESGQAWVDEYGDIHLKNATIRSNGKGFSNPNGSNFYLEGDNYIYAKGLAMYLSDDNIILSEPGSTTQNSLTVESENDYGISVDYLIMPDYDIKLDVYGKRGAIIGRPFQSLVTGETTYEAWLSPYETYVTLRSDGSHPVLVDMKGVMTDDADFVYSGYEFDTEQHTVVYGLFREPVTQTIQMVPKTTIQRYDVQIANHYLNNYNADNFAPQNLRSGSVRFSKFGNRASLYLDNAVFGEESYDEALLSNEKYIDIYVKGNCFLRGDKANSWGWKFSGKSFYGPDSYYEANIYGVQSDIAPELNISGGFSLESDCDYAGSLTIHDLTLNSIYYTYIWSQDDNNLIIDNSTLDLYNDDPESAIMEYIILSLVNSHFEEDGVHWDSESATVVDRYGDFVKNHLKIVAGESSTPTAIDTTQGCDAVLPHQNAAYNLQGQRVGDSYRGIIISNGRKILMK